MTEKQQPIAQAASILATRRKQSEDGPGLPEKCRPFDMATALKIQEAVTAQLGESIAGWKCALPVGDRVIVAPIYRNVVHDCSPCTVPIREGQVRIEPELAFVLGKDLPARGNSYSEEEVDDAIARTHIALELIGSRYTDPAAASFEENLADGLLNQGLFIGPQVDDHAARLAGAIALRVRLESGQTTDLDGRHPNAAPRAPLYWLADFLRSQGQGLRAGEVVITGSYAGSFDVPAGQTISIRYGSLGELAVRFLHG